MSFLYGTTTAQFTVAAGAVGNVVPAGPDNQLIRVLSLYFAPTRPVAPVGSAETVFDLVSSGGSPPPGSPTQRYRLQTLVGAFGSPATLVTIGGVQYVYDSNQGIFDAGRGAALDIDNTIAPLLGVTGWMRWVYLD